MRAFQDYEIVWKDQTYVIPSNRLLPVIAAVEEHITLPELIANTARRRMPVAVIAGAYAAILRAAGVKAPDGKLPISDHEVYADLFADGGVLDRTALAVGGLLGLMIPPEQMRAEPAAPGKPQPASRSSKNSTRRAAARAG
jgi:hypothetical protein